MGTPHADDLAVAQEAAKRSRRRAREDLSQQRELLAHENTTVTAPLREERVTVNHFSDLVREAFQTGYESRHRGKTV